MAQTCRECGCTDTKPCLLPMFGTDHVEDRCSWAEPDLCTACTPDASPRWVHPADQVGAAKDDGKLWQLGDATTMPITLKLLGEMKDSPLTALRRMVLRANPEVERQPKFSDELLAAVILSQMVEIAELKARLDRMDAVGKGVSAALKRPKEGT